MKFTTPALLLAALLSTSLAAPAPEAAILPRHDTCETCNPFPGQNYCDITTSCVSVWAHPGPSPPTYCACRAGYRAATTYDSSAQWRLPWASQKGRVFVKPGVVCDTLCDHYELGADGCKEVAEKPSCL